MDMNMLNMFDRRFDNLSLSMTKELHKLLLTCENREIKYGFRLTLDNGRTYIISKLFIDKDDNVKIVRDMRWNGEECLDFKTFFSLFEKRKIFIILNTGYKFKLLTLR